MINHEQISQRIEAVRMAYGLTKAELAEIMGLDPSSYSKVIAGRKPLKAEHAFAISERFNVPMDFLYRGIETDVPYRVIQELG